MVSTTPAMAPPSNDAGASRPAFSDPWDGAAPFAAQLGVASIPGTQYVECRLGAASGPVDYLCAFSREAAGELHDALLAYASRRAIREDAGCRSALRFLREWDDDGSVVARTVPGIWLEFDGVGGDEPASPTPSLSIGLVPGYRFDRPLIPYVLRRDLPAALAALAAVGVDAQGQGGALLATCFEALPPGARWIHLSVMLGRTPSAVKLYGAMDRAWLLTYLGAIGWRGDFAAVSRLMAEAYGPELVGNEVFVDLNLENMHDSERCSLGLAVAQQHVVTGPNRDPRRARVLDRWTSLGLADSSRARRVVAGLEGRADVFRPDGRFLDLKLVWQAGRAPIAKAYLGSYRLGEGL
jgi:hypothetical protein